MRNSLKNELYIAAVVALLGLLTLTKARAAVETKPAQVLASEDFDSDMNSALEEASNDPALSAENFDKPQAAKNAPAAQPQKAAAQDAELGNLSAEEADFLKAADDQKPSDTAPQAR